jgi:hypothetical protein
METTSLNHRSLNSKQLDILDLLYRFRFATNHLLAVTLNVKYAHKMNERLRVLIDQDYIGRNYGPDYHLRGQSASYYLLPKGINALKATGNEKYAIQVLHNTYKDKNAKDRFISRCLTVFEIFTRLNDKHNNKLQFFTKSELYHYEDFPDPRPDAYFRLNEGNNETQYFLEVLDTTQPDFALKKRIKQFIEYAEGGDWEDATGTPLPTVVLVCESKTLTRRLQKYTQLQVEVSSEEELEIEITSKGEVTAILEPKREPETQ